MTSRLDWNIYFMNIAEAVSLRSPDPAKKVGAIIVDSNNKIISTGYNGLPSKIPEISIDWSDRTRVHNLILHAECNAILYNKSNDINIILYTTLSPCINCLKLIKASGINTVYYKEEYKLFDDIKKIATIFKIQLIKIKN